MPLIVNISEELHMAGQFVQRIGPEINSEGARRVGGRAIGQALKEHFYRLDAERPNALGGRRTHYFAGAARGVQQPQMETDGLSIAINQIGIGHRISGGKVEAGKNISKFTGKPTKFLTIPARAEAYGRRAGEFANLRVLFGRSGPVALVERDATKVIRTSKGVLKAGAEVGGGVFYWLVRSVYHKPDPSVLPPTEAMARPAFEAVRLYLGRLWERKTGSGLLKLS